MSHSPDDTLPYMAPERRPPSLDVDGNTPQPPRQDPQIAVDLAPIDQATSPPAPRGLPSNPRDGHPLMRLQNRSTPSLPSQSGPANAEPVPPIPTGPPPAYDPTNELNSSFNGLRVSDPIPRGSSAMGYNTGDPIPRSGTSMSMAAHGGYYPNDPIPRSGTSMSMHSAHRMGPPRHAATLPPGAAYARGPHPPPSGAHHYPASDAASVYSMDNQPGRYGPPPGSNRSSGYDGENAYDPYQQSYAGSSYSQHSAYGGYPDYQQPQHYAPQEYNQFYAAASDVLGGPPPGAPPLPPSASYGSYPSQSYQQASYPPNGGLAPYPPNQSGLYRGASSASTLRSVVSIDSARPQYHRAGETMDNMSSLSTKKTKAIDVNQPPYTREYVEEYRTRIKGDPDPEVHFAYAKYLIEAAKRIGADSVAQRAVQKYRDALVAEALKVIRRLATQGDAYAEAQFFLATCHGTGMLGLTIDHERAYHLYLQAAKQNHAASSYRVAFCNEMGVGTKREHPRAFAFYKKAASLGDTAAMYKLGMILLHGTLGQQRGPREAIGWLKRAAEQADEENPHALHELGLLHEMPDSSVVVHDEAYAKDLFTRAAQLGYAQSQYKLGSCYEYGILGCPVDPRRSIGWYTKAAEKGDSEAELALSGWYLTGSEGVLKQSDSEAYLWARRAANKGLSKAEYAVGYYAEVGIGVKQDLEHAKRWYMRAAAQGNKRAMNRLTELKRMGNRRTNATRPTRKQAEAEGCIIC